MAMGSETKNQSVNGPVVVGLAVKVGPINDAVAFGDVLFGRGLESSASDQAGEIWLPESALATDDLADWRQTSVDRRLQLALAAQALDAVIIEEARLAGFWACGQPSDPGPANVGRRIHWQHVGPDLAGLTVWNHALAWLQEHPEDTVVVGASDCSDDENGTSAGLALVLQGAQQAKRLGNTPRAEVVTDEADWLRVPGVQETPDPLRLCHLPPRADLSTRFGSPGYSTGLMYVLAGVMSLEHKLIPKEADKSAWPWLIADSRRFAEIEFAQQKDGPRAIARLREPVREYILASPAYFLSEGPGLYLYGGESADDVLRQLKADQADVSTVLQKPWIDRTVPDQPMRLAVVAESADEFNQAAKRAQRWLISGGDERQADLRKGAFWSPEALGGKLALFCNSAATIYPGMGSELLALFGDQMDEFVEGCRLPAAVTRWSQPSTAFASPQLIDMFAGGMYISILHGKVSRNVLGLDFDAVVGLSAGERSAPAAKGVARFEDCVDSLQRTVDGQLLTEHLGGQFSAVRQAWGLDDHQQVQWSVWRVLASVEMLQEALEEFPHAHLAIVHTDDDAMVAGDREQCQQAFEKLSRATTFEIPFYELAYHVPEVAHAERAFRWTKRLEVQPDPDTVYYSSSRGEPFELSTDSFLQVSYEQATQKVDFPSVIERAYDDGIRVFVEHGARDHGVRWIRKILGDRPSAVVPLDRYNINSLRQLLMAVGQLWSVGVSIDWSSLQGRLRAWRDRRSQWLSDQRQGRKWFDLSSFQPAQPTSPAVGSPG